VTERVVVVTSSYPADRDDPSGHFVASDVQRLRGAGHEVLVLAPRIANERSGGFSRTSPDDAAIGPSGERIEWLPGGDAFGWPGVMARLAERPMRAAGVLSFVARARSVLRRSGPWDRLVAHFVVPSVWPIADGLAPACHLEAVLHGSDVRLAARLPGVIRRRIARTLARFEVRCTSEDLRRELETAFGRELARNARVEPPPLDLPSSLGRGCARRELCVKEDARLLVVAGRLVPGKRARVALRAARLVPGASVVVVGDGPERAVLERDFPDVHFVGKVGRTRALVWLAAADALVVASREEGAPSVVREARALGTPVVALPSGDLDVWQRNDPGLLVVPASSPP
jgi:glycosyltransferase involved in cell wall biosynthesis